MSSSKAYPNYPSIHGSYQKGSVPFLPGIYSAVFLMAAYMTCYGLYILHL